MTERVLDAAVMRLLVVEKDAPRSGDSDERGRFCGRTMSQYESGV
jgi:hypothetical protein